VCGATTSSTTTLSMITFILRMKKTDLSNVSV
jgi:hypothetical protein